MVMEITPLDKRRSKVIMDEGFALALYKGDLKRYHIEIGKELPDDAYKELVGVVLSKRAVERVCNLLKTSDKTELQLRQKLREGYYPQEAIEHAIGFLKEYRYLDDEQYARRYAECNSSRKSRKQIQYELEKKGLSREAVSDILEEYPTDEEAQIRDYLRKKRLHSEQMTLTERQKAMAALGRKGFSWDTVRCVFGDGGDVDE